MGPLNQENTPGGFMVYNFPNGEMIYTHEGLCYHVEYEFYPGDCGAAPFIAIRVLRGGQEVKVPPVLRGKMCDVALKDALRTQICR